MRNNWILNIGSWFLDLKTFFKQSYLVATSTSCIDILTGNDYCLKIRDRKQAFALLIIQHSTLT